MKNHSITKLLITATSVIGLGIMGTSMLPSHHIPTSITAHASLTSRVSRFAHQRERYYYPNITYNTRDLGGLKTANDKYEIRPHMLYRSANLHYVRGKSVRELNHLRIHHDIDLRAIHGPNTSISAKPQPGEFGKLGKRGTHIRYHNYPVENSKQEAYTWPIRKRKGEIYRFGYWYTTSPTARRAYHNCIKELIRNGRHPHKNGALVINCTQGRDRTGTASAIIEHILGMRKSVIYNDFLLTNYYKHQSSYNDQLRRISRFYHTAINHYGSMNNYIKKGLNISNRDIRELRHEYLRRI